MPVAEAACQCRFCFNAELGTENTARIGKCSHDLFHGMQTMVRPHSHPVCQLLTATCAIISCSLLQLSCVRLRALPVGVCLT